MATETTLGADLVGSCDAGERDSHIPSAAPSKPETFADSFRNIRRIFDAVEAAMNRHGQARIDAMDDWSGVNEPAEE